MDIGIDQNWWMALHTMRKKNLALFAPLRLGGKKLVMSYDIKELPRRI